MYNYYFAVQTEKKWNNRLGLAAAKFILCEVAVQQGSDNLSLTDVEDSQLRIYELGSVTKIDGQRPVLLPNIETYIVKPEDIKEASKPEEIYSVYSVPAEDREQAVENFLERKWTSVDEEATVLLEKAFGYDQNNPKIELSSLSVSEEEHNKQYKEADSKFDEKVDYYTVSDIYDIDGVDVSAPTYGLFSTVHDEVGGYFCGYYSYEYYRKSTLLAYRYKDDDGNWVPMVLREPKIADYGIRLCSAECFKAKDANEAIQEFIDETKNWNKEKQHNNNERTR